MAVDMAKAFDTLSNGFLEEVLKFFGFGPEIRKWLMLLGKNRTVCILLDNGEISRNFFLERGRPQGDNISPNTFNFCMQILIFRLELDPTIKCIPRAVPQLTTFLIFLIFFCMNRTGKPARMKAWQTTTPP